MLYEHYAGNNKSFPDFAQKEFIMKRFIWNETEKYPVFSWIYEWL